VDDRPPRDLFSSGVIVIALLIWAAALLVRFA